MKIVNTKTEQEPVKFEELDEGQCFKMHIADTEVWMKTDYDQDAVSLIDGEYYSDLCEEDVYPVNAEIHILD